MKNETKKPNFLLIVVDDMGYSDCEPFGGEIRTPNLVKLAEEGVRFRHFYTSSLCAPTRSLLLTGVDNHLNGLGVMPPLHTTNQFMKPGYEGTLNGKVATIAELLSLFQVVGRYKDSLSPLLDDLLFYKISEALGSARIEAPGRLVHK